MNDERCPFTGARCDGGEVPGCGFKASHGAPCDMIAEVPEGEHPRDWYNARILEVSARCD